MSMSETTPMLASLERDGFARVDQLIGPRLVDELIAWCEATPDDGSAVARRGAIFARRNLLDDPLIRAIADHADVRSVVDAIVGKEAFAVRAILFDKTPDANWTVPWHQDRSIAVEAKIETAGFGPWSEKAGVVHVQPPVEVLQSMVTVRIHLDACDDDNGPLRVVPATHSTLLNAAGVDAIVATVNELKCCVPSGGAVIMRPLILHASSPARTARHRRTIHIEYAAAELPNGLRWRFT